MNSGDDFLNRTLIAHLHTRFSMKNASLRRS